MGLVGEGRGSWLRGLHERREDDALVKSIRALHVQEAGLPQEIEGMTLCREMPAQTPAGGITDLKFLDQSGVLQSALVEIAHRFGVAIELLLIDPQLPQRPRRIPIQS
jgi:hypothetical protein